MIADLLRKSEKARSRDILIFSRWERGDISTKEAIAEFKTSNRCEVAIINEGEFERWLNSLGWKRHGRTKRTD